MKLKTMASKYRYWNKPTKVGYKRKGYSWNKSIKSYKKTGYFKVVKSGAGHDAGFRWAEAKQIDPNSNVRRYSKNSPSFDEGVYRYKEVQKQRQKMKDMASKVKQWKPSQKSTPPKVQEEAV